MKKNPVSKCFNNHSGKKQANRKSRTLQLETLETRQLLSAASLMDCADALYDSNDAGPYKVVTTPTFSVNCGNSRDGEIVAMYVKGGNIDDITLKDGSSAQILNKVQEDQIACLLVKMGADSTFTVDANEVSSQAPVTVFVTRPGDQDADGVISEHEYNCVFGNVLRNGRSQQIQLFVKLYGINPSEVEFNSLLDTDHDGKLSNEEFQNYGQPGYEKGSLGAVISTTPQIGEIKFDGFNGTAIPGKENSFVIKATPSTKPTITFQLSDSESLKVQAKIVYQNAAGESKTIKKIVNENGETKISIPLEDGVFPDSTVKLTIGYEGLTEGSKTYSYTFNTAAPSLVPGLELISENLTYDSKVYTQDTRPDFKVTFPAETDWTKVLAEIADPAQGIWLVLAEGETTLKEIKLTSADITKIQAGTYTITPKTTLAEGEHTLKIYTRDFVGNKTVPAETTLTIDNIPPAVEDVQTKYYVNDNSQELTITVTDKNLKAGTDGMTMVSDKEGKVYTLDETPVVSGESITYKFTLPLAYGKNVWTFTATDAAGNSSEKTFTYDYNKKPVVNVDGEKLDGANIKITTQSTTAKNNKELNETVGTITDGKLNLGKVSDLFTENDDSTIIADTDHITIENLGTTVSDWTIDKDSGELILTLATFETEIETFRAKGVKITYKDEYNETASVTFDLAWTNDTTAPSATLDENDKLVTKVKSNYIAEQSSAQSEGKTEDKVGYYYTGTTDIVLTFTVTDSNAIKDGKVTINGTKYTIGEDNKVTILLANPLHNESYEFKYTAEDEFGNKILDEGSSICTIFVDQKVDVANTAIGFKGINPRDQKAEPTFEAQFSGLTEPGTLILYRDGEEVAREAVESEVTDKTIKSSALTTNGIYTFTAKLFDAAGNFVWVGDEAGLTYYFDTAAPSVEITNDAEDKTGVTSDSYKLNLKTTDEISGVDSVKIAQTYIDKQGISQTIFYESTTDFAECMVTLQYGVNTFTYTSTDKAGNTSNASNEFSVIYNLAPVSKPEASFTQTISCSQRDTEGNVTFDLNDYLTDEAIASLVMKSEATITGKYINSATIADGKLVVNFGAITQAEGQQSVGLSFTVADKFGKTLDVTFNFTYLFDSFAPSVKPTDITVANESGTVSAYTDYLYYVNGSKLNINATVTDDSGIASCGWKLYRNGEAVEGKSGTTENIHVSDLTITNGEVYTLKVWGKDKLDPANESTEADPSCVCTFTVDTTAPTATSNSELQTSTGLKAANQTLINDSQPRISYTVTATDTNLSTCKLFIYRDGVQIGENMAFSGTLTNDTALSDKEYTYTFKVVDAAGNESEEYTLITFTVDTTSPVLNVTNKATEVFVAQKTDGKARFDITANDTNELEKLEYCVNNGEWKEIALEDGAYAGTDVEFDLTYGENDFRFRATDKAGNVTTSEVFNVRYDHKPEADDTKYLDEQTFTYNPSAKTIEIRYSKADVKALFIDQDNDLDTYDFDLRVNENSGVEVKKYEPTETETEYVFTLNVTDSTLLKAVHQLGCVDEVTVTDKYGQTASTKPHADIMKQNLVPEEVTTVTAKSAIQNETGVFEFDLSDCFTDPEGDDWTISSATATNNVATAIDGQKVTVTLPEGKAYGTFQLKVKARDDYDSTRESAAKTLTITIDWAGVTSISLPDITTDENAGTRNYTATIGNAFDASKALGGYTKSTEFTVTADAEKGTVNGFVVTNEGKTRSRVACKTLTTNGEFTFTNGVLTFTPATNAYGNVTLTLSAKGETQTNFVTTTTTLALNNLESSPYAPTQNGSFTLTGDTARKFDILSQCDAGEDSGNVSFTSLTASKLENDTLTITKDNHTYTLIVTKTTDGFTVQRDKIDGKTGDDKAWEALNGEVLTFNYVIHNDTHVNNTNDAVGTYKLTFNAIARSVSMEYARAQEAKDYTIALSEFTNYFDEGYKIKTFTRTSGSEDVKAEVNADGSVKVSIAAGCDTDTVFEYTLSNGSNTYKATLSITIPAYNWEPELINTGSDSWNINEDNTSNTPSYEWNVNDLFIDPVDKTALTIALKDGSAAITDSRTGKAAEGSVTYKNGKITFKPTDKDFYGTVAFKLDVTDGKAGTKQAAAITKTFDFTLTINNTDDAPEAKVGANLLISGKAGETIDLSSLKDLFYSPDGHNTIVVLNGTETTYTIPSSAKLGTYTVQLAAKDTTNNKTQNFTFTVAVNSSAMITDDSLDLTKQKKTTITTGSPLADMKSLNEDKTLTAAATFAGHEEDGSVLKAGTLLKAGTSFAKNCAFTCKEEQDWFADYGFELDEGEYCAGGKVVIEKDITLTADITITGKSVTATTGSTIKAGSIAGEDSVFGETFTIEETIADAVRVKQIAQASKKVFEKTGDRFVLLCEELSLSVSNPEAMTFVEDFSEIGGAVQYVFSSDSEEYDRTATYYKTVDFSKTTTEKIVSIVDPEIADDSLSPYKFVTYNSATGKFYAYYNPYDVTQERGAQNTVIDFNGTEVTLTLSIDYEVPFEVCYVLQTGEAGHEGATDKRTIASTISAGENCRFVDPGTTLTEGATYTAQVWVKCNLPLIQKDLLTNSPYGAEVLIEKASLTLTNATNVSGYDSGDGANESTYNSSTGKVNFKCGVVTNVASASLNCDFYKIVYVTFTAGKNCSMSEFTRNNTAGTYSLIFDNEISSGVGASGGVDAETGKPAASKTVVTNLSQVNISTMIPNAAKGTSALKETVVEGNGVYMSLVKEKTSTEKTTTLTKSDAYITEWDTSWLELWVNTQEIGTDIANVKFDVNYNPDILYAAQVESSSNVLNLKATSFDDENGKILGITADLTNAVTNEDGFVLVGRIKFTPVENGGVAANTINSTSPGISLANIEMRNSDGFWLDVNTQVGISTKAFAVVYDANDDGEINIYDLVTFARHYGANTVDTTDPGIWALDFNNNGSVDITDLISFARNYNTNYNSCLNEGGKVLYPNNFFQTWIGTTLEMSGDSNVTDTLDNALNAWSKKLGEDLNLNVQIIVKEYENVEGGILGETILLDCGENGKPNEAVIYIDSDALGMGWYVGESDDVQDEQYDLYSVLLHELGHAIGLTEAYDGFESIIQDGIFTDAEGNRHVVFASHVYGETDLMNDTINVGTRSEISDLDVELAKAARENGTTITQQLSNSITGATANVPATELAENMFVIAVSGMMPEDEFTEILTNAATKAVLATDARYTDAVWNDFTDNESTEVNCPTAVTASVLDELFDEEDFTSDIDQIVREALEINLNV